jgi:threonine dehydrogenase-like Zn-dependent dehydrogenase
MLGVLTEPASVVAKAWEHTDYIAKRAHWNPRCVLVTGAGPVGLLAALLGMQRGHEVHVLDRGMTGPKPGLVRAIGATYHGDELGQLARDFDIVMECTGAASLVFDVVGHTAPDAIICLLGVSPVGATRSVDVGALNRQIVLGDRVVFGSVNANRRHYESATRALAAADRDWLRRLITRRVPLHDWSSAFELEAGDVKTVIELS